jgi:DNA-binding NarL/FixJ family response regulator
LYGRADELAAIDALLDGARDGHGGGLALRGEPGIGKTALLEYAAGRAGGMRVLRTVGVEPESDLAYATLHRLLLPVLDGIDKLPSPQAHALRVVFGQEGDAPPDRFLVALATLSLLSDVAPLACLVDDAQWADGSSLNTLAFVARRLSGEPIAMVLAGRTVNVPDLTEVRLSGLDRAAGMALLNACGKAERDDLLRATGGNPLAIRELPATAHRDVGAGSPVPLAARLRRAFLERARRRSLAAQRLLLLIAADGSAPVETVGSAAESLGWDPSAPGLDDLITRDGGSLAFRHPLIRSAVYHGATPDERRAVHRALAEAHTGDRRAWHLGQAAEGADERVAAELERFAERATRRAGPAAAAAALERAAELSESETTRARRSVAAATAWWHGGDTSRAVALLEQAEHSGPAGLEIIGLRALIELRTGSPADALALLLPVLGQAFQVDRRRAIELLMHLGEASFHANVGQAWFDLAPLLESMPLDGDDADTVLLRLVRGVFRGQAGGELGLAPGDLAAVEEWTDPVRLLWAGGIAWGLGDPDMRRRLCQRGVRRARALGAIGTLAWGLWYEARDELARGRYATAEACAEEGHRFALEAGQPNVACGFQGLLAVLAVHRGRLGARRLAERVLEEAGARALAGAFASARHALGLLELAAGRPVQALEQLERLRGAGDLAHPAYVMGVVPDLVEAAVRADRPGRATGPLDQFAEWAEATHAPSLRAVVARCRALLATDDAAEDQFRAALDLHERTDEPIERARTELLFGQFLRRQRRRADARPPLRAALETFTMLGASTWADLARAELRAAGESIQAQPGGLDGLTPQELRIVTAVSSGATNREVAAQLFLSPRTVDYHLRKVFQKTGVSSRTELVKLVRS